MKKMLLLILLPVSLWATVAICEGDGLEFRANFEYDTDELIFYTPEDGYLSAVRQKLADLNSNFSGLLVCLAKEHTLGDHFEDKMQVMIKNGKIEYYSRKSTEAGLHQMSRNFSLMHRIADDYWVREEMSRDDVYSRLACYETGTLGCEYWIRLFYLHQERKVWDFKKNIQNALYNFSDVQLSKVKQGYNKNYYESGAISDSVPYKDGKRWGISVHYTETGEKCNCSAYGNNGEKKLECADIETIKRYPDCF